MSKIALCTMVRNEGQIIERLITSCRDIVDLVILTDTGSTDDTITKATEVCQRLGLIINVRQDQWSDFGTNRTRNLEHAQEYLLSVGQLDDYHLLLLDGDMRVPAGTTKPDLLPDLGLLPQQDPSGSIWWNVRVMKANIKAKYIGRTHEYLACDAAYAKMNWFTIDDRCDGGTRTEKFERDERLLRLDLAEKNDTRSMFYLAQTLQNTGRYHEAIQWYDARALVNDFPEEAWMARFEASRCCALLGKVAEANERALNAFATRPCRAEPLAEVAKRCADTGQHQRAMMLAENGKKIPYPVNENLYCSRSHYRWDFLYTEMISAYYTGQSSIGLNACERLHLTHGSPFNGMAICNMVFYVQPIPGKRIPIEVSLEPGWNPASPCFMPWNDGFLALVRTVNYQITPEGYFVTPDGICRTKTAFTFLNKDYQIVTPLTFLKNPEPEFDDARIRGFEDQRIWSFDGKILTLYGVRCDANKNGIPELWMSQWDTEGNYLEGRRMSNPNRCEKNWLRVNDSFLYLHETDAITFVDGDGKLNRSVQTNCGNLGSFRGSSAPIRWGDGWLYVIHEVATRGRRAYLHRLVIASHDFSEIHYSKPFTFKGQPCMESCFSVNQTTDGIVLSIAYEDKEIYAIEVSNETIKDLIYEVPPLQD